MSDTEAAASPIPLPNDIESLLPPVGPEEPADLQRFRDNPAHEPTFRRLRRTLREKGDWRSLATLMAVHAAGIAAAGAAADRVIELCTQAHELWADRAGDPEQAAYAAARAFRLASGSDELYEKLRDAYRAAGMFSKLATLLRWRVDHLKRVNVAGVPGVLVEIGELGEHHFMNVERAITLYKQAIALDPRCTAGSERLIQLHFSAGAWLQASDLMNAELKRLAGQSPQRAAELHLRLARIEYEQLDNIGAAAQHLHQALKAAPDSVRALRAFGVLYLGSGKASEEGLAKAADVFFKAAKLAREQGDAREALKLVRRSLTLRPDHYEGGLLLAELLTERERWMELDELYRSWIEYVTEEDAYGLWFSRGDLLETRLSRREEARMCFETASQYEAIDGQAWQRLETLYADLGDDHALVSLYEARVEHMPESMTTEQLLTAARVYRDNLKDDERASFFFYKVLEREPFNPIAFEGYKEHWRRKNNWLHLRDLILYQIDQAMSYQGDGSPLRDPAFAQEFIEVAEICVKRLGDIHGAIDVWNRMAQCYPRDPRPRTELAAIDKRSRAWERAEQAQFDELARTSDPEGRMIPLRRLSALYSERLVDAERAMEVYDELVATAPDDRAVMDGLIEVYERTGSWDAVIQLLRQQYEVSRSPGERVDLLRRMAELWHHELESHEDAIWACNEILTFHEGDLEALHRLQTLYNEHSHHEAHYDCLERELRLSEDPADKIRLLRQMANVAEHHLQDSARSSAAWYELHDLDPHNLEVVDKLIVAYEQAAQWAELADLLGKTASSKRTPKIRQLDYSLRLGYLAQDTLHDPDRACSAFERAVRIHRYHRGAVESLTRLYREIKSWHSLAATLGTLREIVDSDEEALQIGWEQAEVLAEQLDNAPAAIRVLEQLAAEVAVGNRDVSLRLLELYERAQQPRKLIRQAEILLLSSNALDERRDLFASIARAWIEVGDAKAAASAFSRFRAEFPDDPEGVRIEAELREAGGDHAGTLALLEQQLAAFEHIDEKLSTLEHMAKVCERMGEPRRGLALLGRALSITPDPESSLTTIETYAARHGLWKDMLALLSNRYTELSSGADPDGQMAACMRSARIAAEELGDPQMAFSWGKKAYFVALEHRLDAGPALDFLEALAEKHALWEELLGVTEQELKVRSQSSAIEDYATINLLLTSSEIALTRLADPARAINYLHRAHELRPDDKDLARQIEDLAKKHGKFQELIRLGERRMRQAGSALARFEVCIDIARIYEKDLEDPAGSFHYLRRTWKEFRETESSLAEEALDMAVALGERYELWSELASHHVELARGHFKRPGGRRDGFDALLEGAKVEEEQREDLLGAIRILREGLEFDPDGEELLPIIESLAERHDEARDDGAPATGALAVLGVLQRLIAAADRRGKIRLLTRRAELREGRLADPVGAMAEWLRVLELDPEHPAAQAALERLAEQQQRWDLALLLPAAEHERLRDEDPDEHVEELRACLAEIAQIYEERLACPEFALRARLAAWRLRPELPTPEDADELEPPVDPEHATLWRLAAAIGDFHSPPPPPDLLQPRVSPPEIADEALWRRAGLDSTTLRPRVERAEEEPEDEGLIELSSIDALPEGAPRREPTNVVDIEELEEIEASVELSGVGKAPREPTNVVNIDELEEITDEEVLEDIPELDAELGAEALDDLEELGDLDDLDDLDALEDLELLEVKDPTGVGAPPKARAKAVAKAAPPRAPRPPSGGAPKPPPPRTPPKPPGKVAKARTVGLPNLPRLTRPIVNTRPAATSAWEEIAGAYSASRSGRKQERIDVAVAVARMWSAGAGQPEPAFAQIQDALVLKPDHEDALACLDAIARRHDAQGRLIAVLERVQEEVTLPENIVRYALRLALLYEEAGRMDQAVRAFEGVLAVMPRHLEALAALARIHEVQGRQLEFLDVSARLLDAEASALPIDERIAKTLTLVRDLAEEPDRIDEALRRVRALTEVTPEEPEVHEQHATLLARVGRVEEAAAVLAALCDRLRDPTRRLVNRITLARLREQLLERDPAAREAAIAAWEAVLEDEAGNAEALGRLQEHYLATSRHDALLPILDARLDSLPSEDTVTRVTLRVLKARALQEGPGDEEAATSLLEELLSEAPENDEIVLGLAGLYGRSGRHAEATTLLRERLDTLPEEQVDRRTALACGLVDTLLAQDDQLDAARAAIDEISARAPESRAVLARRVTVAERQGDDATLVDCLEALGGVDELLRAASLATTSLRDSPRAARLYERVLELAKTGSPTPEEADRLTHAIAGLTRIKIEAGDHAGARLVMGEQLPRLRDPSRRARLLTEMGYLLLERGVPIDVARACFDAALEEDPDHAAAHLRLGEGLLAIGDLEAAEAQLEAAIETLGLTRDTPRLVQALILLARVLERTDRPADAHRHLSAALRQDPDNFEIHAAITRNRHAAGRWRDALSTITSMEERLEKLEESGELARLDARSRGFIAEMLVIAADCERRLKQQDKAVTRYQRAIEFQPGNRAARTALIEMCQEHGLMQEAAGHALALAEATEDPIEQGKAYVHASMLFHEAARALREADAEAEHTSVEVERLRAQAFECARKGLDRVRDVTSPVLHHRQLAGAFWAAAPRDAELALACLDRLRRHDQVPAEARHAALIEGVALALRRRASGDEGELERARGYARSAIDAFPESSAAVMAMCDVLEAAGQTDAIEPLVLEFFNTHGLRSKTGANEQATRSALLVRLAELQEAHPERVIRLLEYAERLDADGLGITERRQLAALYQRAGVRGARVLRNYEALLALDPLDRGALRALANLSLQSGNPLRAYACFDVLAALDPDDHEARQFLTDHALSAPDGGSFDVAGILEPPPPNGGVVDVLTVLWKGGAAMVCKHLPRLDVPEGAVVGDDDSTLARAWTQVRAQLSAPRFPLVRARDLTDPVSMSGVPATPRCQYPPVVLVNDAVAASGDDALMRFALGRALYFARPQAILAAALPRETLTHVLSAILRVFHPRHSRRRPPERAGDDGIAGQLANTLSRGLPVKLARQLTETFEKARDEHFDSREWRAWIQRGGNRTGLCLSGSLRAALDVFGLPIKPAERAAALLARAPIDSELRDLLVFASSARFVAALRDLGYTIPGIEMAPPGVDELESFDDLEAEAESGGAEASAEVAASIESEAPEPIDATELEDVEAIEPEAIDVAEIEAIEPEAIDATEFEAMEAEVIDAVELEPAESEPIDAAEPEAAAAIELEPDDPEAIEAIEPEAIESLEPEALDAIELEPVEPAADEGVEAEEFEGDDLVALDEFDGQEFDDLEDAAFEDLEAEALAADETADEVDV